MCPDLLAAGASGLLRGYLELLITMLGHLGGLQVGF